MNPGGIRGSNPPSGMTGSHETRDGEMKHFILTRFTTPTPVVADKILFVPLILFYHLHFKVLCNWKKKKRMTIWKSSEAWFFPPIHIQHCLHSVPSHQCMASGPGCCWGTSLGIRKAAEPACLFGEHVAHWACCWTLCEQQLSVWGKGMFCRSPGAPFMPPQNTSHARTQCCCFIQGDLTPVPKSQAQTRPSRMAHGWCKLKVSFKK